MANIICVANQKGGTGKTTSTVNFASYFARQGKKSLILDMEPQANATLSVGLEPNSLDKTIYEVLLGECSLREAIIKDVFKNLDIAPANVSLANTDINLGNQPNSQFRLKENIPSVMNDYEYIFIDCPPSLSLLVMNSFAAADNVLIPLQADYLSLEGLAQLVKSIRLTKKHLNPNLEIVGILFCIVITMQKITRESIDLTRQCFGNQVFNNVIRSCVKLKECASHGMSIFDYAPLSWGAFNYGSAAKELQERCIALNANRAREEMISPVWTDDTLTVDTISSRDANI